jgi:signal transduction histidine kinase
VRRRFNAVSETMHAVSHGQLSTRIPLLGRGDDIDALAGDINEALERLERTVEGMRQVSGDIAHELKTPLSRLSITIEEALERGLKGQQVTQQLNEAAEEVNRVNGTFEALLRISQIKAGSRKARFAPVDPLAVLESLGEVYLEVAEDAGHRLLFIRNDGPFTEFLGDREFLTQMFANLIENAIRHCPEGATISIRLRCEKGNLEVRVEDNGPGIPEAEWENVFRRLYRLDKSRSSDGAGLGLSLVRAVAELHDATVVLEDMKPGIGVIVRFPTAA